MAKIFLTAAAVLVGFAFPLGGYILAKDRTVNFHKIWDLASVGNQLARVYLAVVALAFTFAVVGWFLALSEHRGAKLVANLVPNQALQRTASGVR